MPVETRITAVSGPLHRAATAAGADVLAVPTLPGGSAAGAEIDPAFQEDVAALLAADPAGLLAYQKAKGEPGEIVAAPARLPGEVKLVELLLYGVGDASPRSLRQAGAALARRAKGRTALAAAVPEGGSGSAADRSADRAAADRSADDRDGRAADLAAFAEGALLASYDFRIGEPPKKGPVGEIAVVTADGAGRLARGTASAAATALARDLTNTPAREKSPAWLARRAEEIAASSGLGVRVRDEDALRDEGFGGLLAVGSGSARPPRLIELSYEPAGASRHVVLVGKGITFDSGGLSLKPNEGMKTMKTDMGGGAAVMAVMSALRDLGVPDRVTGLVAAAENLPSGSAMRPSDVIEHYGGKTSEVLNTDAEGRLVLADALAYADAVLRPDVVVDVATLTGAAKVALGLRRGALFATDDDLAAALSAAGEAGGEPVWRLPLVEDYRQAIDSDVADVANIERRGFGGGSIMAALFLREFVGKVDGRTRPWAHLDVAGPARATSDDAEITKGATGFGTRLLLSWLAPPG